MKSSDPNLNSVDKVLSSDSISLIDKITILSEALPCVQKFVGETFVIKYDSSTINNDSLLSTFAQDIVLLKQSGVNPVVVYSLGDSFAEDMRKFNLEPKFVHESMIIDEPTIELMEMWLCGFANKKLVQKINQFGGSGIGISCKDCNLIQAKKSRRTFRDKKLSNIEKIVDVGFYGEISSVNPDILFFLEESDFIPVISPIVAGEDGSTYYIDSDDISSALARAISAAKLILLNPEQLLTSEGNMVAQISTTEANKLIEKCLYEPSLISALKNCVLAVKDGCSSAHILNSKTPHSLLLELFTKEVISTVIIPSEGDFNIEEMLID